MKSQHLSEELCLDYLTGELPAGENASFKEHLGLCLECQSRVEEYRELMRHGLPSMADELVEDPVIVDLPWPVQGGEERLYAALGQEIARSPECDEATRHTSRLRLQTLKEWIESKHFRVTSAATVSILAMIGLGISLYRVGWKRGLQQSESHQQLPVDYSSLQAQLHKLMRERDTIQASLMHRETLISELRAQLTRQRKQTETLEESLRSANVQAEEQRMQTRQVSSQRDQLARKLDDEQGVLASAQKRIDALQQAETHDAFRVVSLENQIQEMSRLAKDREGTIDEQQRMLAADRDIRDLMGARDLYIAEVYDVGGNGKRKRPYGRVFYTKGKSLIFYAYDLDQEPGLKSASSFQAWGLRGPDRKRALNLGVMYVDNSTNKRWVLRFDDPKALEEINAVFVTVEPSGGSRVPQGQQVLFAYLREEPNHP